MKPTIANPVHPVHPVQDFHLPTARRFIAPDAPGKIQILPAEITTSQFARMVGLCPSRVRGLCDEGRVKFRRLPGRPGYGRIRIPVTELQNWLRDNEPA
jgi:hypothetical protein